MCFMIISIIVISVIGTVSHFSYDISKQNKIVGLFGAVNESTWEHIKIALTATILWSVVDGYFYGVNSNYFLAKLVSLITIIILMPVLYYGYKYLFKKDNFIVNILIFYIVIICSQYLFFYIINIDSVSYLLQYISCIGIFIVFGFYMVLTLMPIKNFLFKDPVTKKYGFNRFFNNKKGY